MLDTTDLSISEADFDAVGMGGGVGQNIFDDAAREFACALILLEDDGYSDAGANIFAGASVCHIVWLSATVFAFKRILPETCNTIILQMNFS